MHYPSDNVAVMVSFSTVKIPINKMSDLLEGVSLNTQYPMESEAIRTILYECLNEYLQFTLPKIPGNVNICFEHYLHDRFKAIAHLVNPPQLDNMPPPDKRWMMYLNAQWAIAVSELGRQLLPGVRDLNNHAQDVNEIQVFATENPSTGLYVLSGVHYDVVDMNEEGL